MNTEPVFSSKTENNSNPFSELSEPVIDDAPDSQEKDYSKSECYSEDPVKRNEQLTERLKLKSKILQYQEKFPEELKAYMYKMDKLDSLSTEDLKIFIDELRIAVRQSGSMGIIKIGYFSTVEFVEKLSCKVGYNVKGFKDLLFQQKEIHKCLDELALEWQDNVYVPPLARLGFYTFQTAAMLHQVRSLENVTESEMKKKIPNEISEMYSDL